MWLGRKFRGRTHYVFNTNKYWVQILARYTQKNESQRIYNIYKAKPIKQMKMKYPGSHLDSLNAYQRRKYWKNCPRCNFENVVIALK